jgi:hypothetical protein
VSYRLPSSIVEHLRSWGLTVVELPGWQARGADFPARPVVIVDHHTGTPDTVAGDLPTQRVLEDGRSDLEGPLCQFALGRSGTVYLVAAGKANHAGKGSWDGINVGNSRSVGIEAESAGGGHWAPAQLVAYPLLNAALCDFLEQPASRVCAHRESALPHGRKDDPVGIDMNAMRAEVRRLLEAGPPTVHAHDQAPPTSTEEDTMQIVRAHGRATALLTSTGKLVSLEKGEGEVYMKLGIRDTTLSTAEFDKLDAVSHRVS